MAVDPKPKRLGNILDHDDVIHLMNALEPIPRDLDDPPTLRENIKVPFRTKTLVMSQLS